MGCISGGFIDHSVGSCCDGSCRLYRYAGNIGTQPADGGSGASVGSAVGIWVGSAVGGVLTGGSPSLDSKGMNSSAVAMVGSGVGSAACPVGVATSVAGRGMGGGEAQAASAASQISGMIRLNIPAQG